MAEVRETIRVDAPVTTVWAVLADIGAICGLESRRPGISSNIKWICCKSCYQVLQAGWKELPEGRRGVVRKRWPPLRFA